MSSCEGLAILLLILFTILFETASSSCCSDAFLQEAEGRNITTTHCKKLTTLGAEFGWYIRNINTTNNASTIDIFFGAKVVGGRGWLAWGVNPNDRPQMVGSRALIGIKHPNGSHIINTYNITAETKLGCRLLPSEIELEVQNKKFDYSAGNNYFIIIATLVLPPVYNISKLHHVWQVGHSAAGDEPKMHPTTLQNVDSTDTIDLKTGNVGSVGQHRHHLRMVHGILNIVGWGTLLPMGVIMARYFSKFPIKFSWWLEIHISCQIVGFLLGTTGFAIGLWLGHASKYYTFHTHGVLAIIIFTFTALQMLALRLKPREDDEYRKYWNMYHHFLGYALMAVIATNIFHGISILKPNNTTWKWAYVGVLVLLGCIVVAFEISTWVKFWTLQKKLKAQKKEQQLARNHLNHKEGTTTGP